VEEESLLSSPSLRESSVGDFFILTKKGGVKKIYSYSPLFFLFFFNWARKFKRKERPKPEGRSRLLGVKATA